MRKVLSYKYGRGCGKKASEAGAIIGSGARGRGKAPGYGFPTVETFTFEEALANPEYSKYVQAMIEQIEKLHQIIQRYKK